MAGVKEGGESSKEHTMKGGNEINSYAKNSSIQRKTGDYAKSLIEFAIAEKLDMAAFPSTTIFRIADLGCSVGPNTFLAVQTIIKAIENKVSNESQSSKTQKAIFEFQVFFNDLVSNDFNTLFISHEKYQSTSYYAAGVPGSFYGRLFPTSSLHFVYSSCAINYLSRVPEKVFDKSSSAWNKGKIHYSNSTDEVALAYVEQHEKDMEKFWEARAKEIVHGGLMVLIVPARHNHTPHSGSHVNILVSILGSCLLDMVNKGEVDEEKLDSFNLSLYLPCQDELKKGINHNGCFKIEKIETLPREIFDDIEIGSELTTRHLRAAMEGRIKDHFGLENLDELFNMFKEKLREGYSDITSKERLDLSILLKRT